MLAAVDKAMSKVAGSEKIWQDTKAVFVATGRWNEVLY